MEKQKVSPEARCPCRSRKKYKNCCITKRFEWVMDDQGNFYRAMPMHPELESALLEQKKRFVKMFGREPQGDDPVLFDAPTPEEIEEKTVDLMRRAGVREEIVYAYLRTGGLIITTENHDLLPDNEIQEWEDAIHEFRAISKLKVKLKPDHFFKALDRLSEELERAETYLNIIIREHGIARNISAKEGEKIHSLHDYVFLCATKSLKTLRAIKQLIPEAFGEDALILCRSIYESYLSINHVLTYPKSINSFVAGRIGIRVGDYKPKGTVIVDVKTGKTVAERISVRKMAEQSRFEEDLKIYNFLYRYLSEFTHADIMAIESYLDKDRFDPSRSRKVHHTVIYGLFLAVLLLDILSSLSALTPRFKNDLISFIKSAAKSLQRVFSQMTESDGSKSLPKLFIARLKRCARSG